MTSDLVVIFFAEYAHYFVVVIAGFVFLLSCSYNHKKQLAKIALVSIVLAIGMDKLLNQIISSPRPFTADGVVPLFTHVADNGFPSEHTLLAIVIAALVCIQNKKIGLVLVLLAVTIGIARVVAGVHHLIDVLGAILIGVLAVLIGQLLVTRYSVASL